MLSVVIPTYNRVGQLRVCVDALARQTQVVNDFEVIIVVDGATDNTLEVLAGLRVPYPLLAVPQARAGQHAARNVGVASARGRYLLFLDDDIVAGPRLVAEHLRLQRSRAGLVGLGPMPVVPDPSAHWLVRWFADTWNAHFEHLAEGARLPCWSDCYGGNTSIARDAFLRAGGYATDLPRSHDIELGYRLAAEGLTFVFLPDAVGIHHERKTPVEIAATAEQHGRAAAELCRRHPAALPTLLGTFNHSRPHAVRLRRALLALDVPPSWLARVGALLLPDRVRVRAWPAWVHTYSYWRGVRSAVPDRVLWRQLTGATRSQA